MSMRTTVAARVPAATAAVAPTELLRPAVKTKTGTISSVAAPPVQGPWPKVVAVVEAALGGWNFEEKVHETNPPTTAVRAAQSDR